MRIITSSVLALALAASATTQSYTPTSYQVTLHGVEMSTDGTEFASVFSSSAGQQVDLVDPNSFANAFGSETAIAAGTYKWIRMTIGQDLVWSYPNAPVSLSNQTFTVLGGPPGPVAGQMAVYFATHDQGGRPNGRGGGQGTQAAPFLLGSAPTVVAGRDMTLRMVFAVTNTLRDSGGGNYELQPPLMFFVSEDGAASGLSGTFNTVFYETTKVYSSGGGGGGGSPTVETWDFMSGHGTLTFDGAGRWSWSGTENDFQMLESPPTGQLTAGRTHAGMYGVNRDGSIWMLSGGDSGTLRGALSSDGTMFVATMFDSESNHLVMFGVSQASSASAATLAGNYYFTTYGSRYTPAGGGGPRLDYDGGFGVVVGDGLGGVSGNQDTNRLEMMNPASTPSFNGPTASTETFSDTMTVNANGTISNSGGELQGGILQSGDAGCIGFDFSTPWTPSHQFGFLVKQSTSGTFSEASLNGTYFGAHFGDRFESGSTSMHFYSGFFRVVFDGQGAASVTVAENREGQLDVQTFAQNYTVESATGIVRFADPGQSAGDMRGAIGPGAGSFLLSADHMSGSQANDGRFLGLGLKQN